MSFIYSHFDRACVAPMLFTDLARVWRGDGVLVPPSGNWLQREESVRHRYGLMLDRVDELLGSAPLLAFEDRRATTLIRNIHEEMAATPRAADEFLRVTRAAFEFARHNGWVARNPTAGIKEHGCAQTYEDVWWTAANLQDFIDTAKQMDLSEVAHAVLLMACTGLGPTEARCLRFSQVSDHAIVIRSDTGSSRRRSFKALPLLPEAQRFIKDLGRWHSATSGEHVLLGKDGTPWERAKLSAAVKRVRDKAGIVHRSDDADDTATEKPKQVKDLKKTYAVKLMEAGITDSEIIPLMNWPHLYVANLRKAAGLFQPPSARTL